MFILNFKLNGSKTFKVFFSIVLVILFIIIGIVISKFFTCHKNNYTNTGCLPTNNVSAISPKNYTNILKAVHDNIDNYIGTQIKFSGYIYRMYDFTDTQFVLARDMIISSDAQTVVVGFLCESNNSINFADNTWVELSGVIKKGSYHGEIPIIKVIQMNEIQKPDDEYVYPPDDSYIPTNELL